MGIEDSPARSSEELAGADIAWIDSIKSLPPLAGRLVDVRHINSGSVFVTASARHVATRRTVLLTLARPGDSDALTQLGVLRELMTAVDDERVGMVFDAMWPLSNKLAVDELWGCLVSTFHQGVQSLEKTLVTREPQSITSSHVFSWMRSLMTQLHKVHEAGFAHGDISISNLLVDQQGQIHIVDFEHCINMENIGRRRVGATVGFVHPEKVSRVSLGSATINDYQRWDIYGLGQVFLSLLASLTPLLILDFTPRVQRAIRLMGCLLLDGKNTDAELALGLSRTFFVEEHFENLSHAIRALDRVTGRTDLDDFIPELRPTANSVVEVGLQGPVSFTRRVEGLLSTVHMRYLSHICQLGLIRYIWPTATHSRLEHAIGTFGLVCTALLNLAMDPESPLFAVVVDEARAKETILAALLHDVGHYPLAHDLEEAYYSLFAHEDRSIELITSEPISKQLERAEHEGGWNVNPRNVASIIGGKPISGSSIRPSVCSLLHSLISGPIDADKLDYLVRDSHHLNVRAGQGLDRSRVLSSLTVVVIPTGKDVKICVGVRSKGRRPAELVGRVRSHMFGVAYWHHAYRAIKAMIHWLVWDAVESWTRV